MGVAHVFVVIFCSS